ncbi:MAG: DegT/DnrJ/EryC1/StrS family aminotransferase [Rhizobacter sp.]|nr:DegT/DnrJ/EryC1/StrS family aminotransferase [Rhizobacter sp.]
MLRLSLPNIDDAAIAAVGQVLRSGQLVHGEQGAAFERELQEWIGVRHVVLVSSGTAALHLALAALGIGAGDAVLVPDFTFPATANVVLLSGARPVLVDVDTRSYCITPETLAAAIESWRGPERLRAMMPVHEFGHSVDVPALRAIATAHGLRVIEDAACAIGATHSGTKAGAMGDIGCFSMHPRKTLTTGEGGFLTTGDDALARRLRRLRNHGMERSNGVTVFHEAGFNYRLTDFQSALGRAQLPRLQGWIEARRALAQAYSAALAPLAERGLLTLPDSHPGHSWQTYMVALAEGIDRAAVISALAAAGLEANLGAQCLSAQPAFAACARSPSATSNALRLDRQGLALPFCEQYGSAEIARVASALTNALRGTLA